ncbi:hypothetical protein OQA88_1218 [Cercophora sp. LCS_1]
MVGPFADPFQVPFSRSDLLTASSNQPSYPSTASSSSCLPEQHNTTVFEDLFPASNASPTAQNAQPFPIPLELDDQQQDLQISDLFATAAQWDEIQGLQRELQRTVKERDEARMTVSTLRNEVYTARQTEKRLRAERDEARGQVAFLKKERAAGRATETRLRRERDAARAVAVRRKGRGILIGEGFAGGSPEDGFKGL